MADPSHSSAHSAAPSAHEPHSALRYYVVWIVLVILTFATFTFAKMNLGAAQLPVAMLIALTKATLVVLIFMHLAEQKGANRLVFCLALSFVALMISVILADVVTRFPFANPPTDQRPGNTRPYHAPSTEADSEGPRPQPGDHPYP